jgi:uncharacterized membrane protein (TIGR02234 family)
VRRHLPFAIALLLDLAGGGVALLLASRHWQTIRTPRPAPLHEDVLQLTGRTVDAAPTALALVALAGVVALVASRGLARRIVGAVLALAGVVLVWRSVTSAGAVSTGRARSLVAGHHATVDAGAVVPHVTVHGTWPALSAVCGALVCASGALVAWRGHRWQTMSARYAAPGQRQRGETATTMWTALDRGEDPT